jgi:soluble lytic murein transglycosylase-like protein
LRRRWLVVWYVLLTLLVVETVLYGVADYASGYCLRAVRREFNAAASDWQQIDKVPYAEMINNYACREGLSARLVASVIQAESSFRPRAVSRTGAMGLMQVMPATWRQMNDELHICVGRHSGECTTDCYFDPELNIRVGTAYLGRQAKRFGGDLTYALAAYNAGPGAVQRYGGIPPIPETQDYVEQVIANWYVFADRTAPPYSLAAHNWQWVRRILGWSLAATTGLTIWTIIRLKRTRRSWRWR